jgi:signal peptidase I
MARDSEALVAPAATRAKSTIREWVEAIFVAILLALAIRTFVVQAFKIPSGSMLPTLEIGDHILVNKFVYGARLEVPLTTWSFGQLPGLREPRQGDVIVFVYPKDRDKDYIKRVIAVAGQTIEVRRSRVRARPARAERAGGALRAGVRERLAGRGSRLRSVPRPRRQGVRDGRQSRRELRLAFLGPGAVGQHQGPRAGHLLVLGR